MKTKLIIALVGGLALAACSDNDRLSTNPSTTIIAERHGPPQEVDKGKHVHRARGYKGPAGPFAPLGPLTFHNGSILRSAQTYTIFWGTSWGADSAFTADKITGLEAFFRGFGGSTYAHTLLEYYGQHYSSVTCSQPCYLQDHITESSSFGRSFIDNGAAPAGDPSVSAVINEVASVLRSNGLSPTYYALYSVYATTPRPTDSTACAWHSSGSIGGVPIEVAWYFNLDGDLPCDPGDDSGLHSQGLAALANVTAHALSEAITDPTGGGWYATNGTGESGDKCAWVFNVPLVSLSNGAQFKIQGEWSNKAYAGNYGYATSMARRAV